MKIAKWIGSLGLFTSLLLAILRSIVFASAPSPGEEQLGEAPALTIYNQKFAVIRQKLPLNLKPGTTHVEITDITAHLEPDSVVLRSVDAGRKLQVLEQNYRNDGVTQQLLLSLYEGKTIDFMQADKDGNQHMVPGKVIRSGYAPHPAAYNTYGQQYYQQQAASVQSGGEQPIIEVNDKSTPGTTATGHSVNR